jgi:hypothetical protein
MNEKKIRLKLLKLQTKLAAGATRQQIIQNKSNWWRIETVTVTGNWLVTCRLKRNKNCAVATRENGPSRIVRLRLAIGTSPGVVSWLLSKLRLPQLEFF